MAGGLLNIVSVGNSNLILTGNPTKTFFKVVYSFETGTVYDRNIPFVSNEFGLTYSFSQPNKQTIVVPRFY
jgi:hypothetical protein